MTNEVLAQSYMRKGRPQSLHPHPPMVALRPQEHPCEDHGYAPVCWSW